MAVGINELLLMYLEVLCKLKGITGKTYAGDGWGLF